MTNRMEYVPIDKDNPAISRREELCAKCGHCVAACMEGTGMALRYLDQGGEGTYPCLQCGQCTAVCPENAIFGKQEYQYVKEAIQDPEKIVIFSTSPSVRVGLGDAFYTQAGTFVEDKMVAALRALGGDYVLDVTFSADLTILEEGVELIGRLVNQEGPLPQFTSCCPAWVKFVEQYHSDKIPHLSSAKSPIGMQGATVKTYFAKEKGLDPEKIVHVAVTPCTAKKMEIRRGEFCDAGIFLGKSGMRDNDYVITTSELAQWLEEEGISFASLAPSTFDSFMGRGSGGGLIFGNTGGVMEAALRTAYTALTGNQPSQQLLQFESVRGLQNVKEAKVEIGDLTLRVAVVYGIAAAETFLQKGIADYHFIEVMTCPGGCISGAGQPKMHITPVPNDLRERRMASLYQEDEKGTLRNSIENPEISKIYKEFYGKPGSQLAKQLLHTKYGQRQS